MRISIFFIPFCLLFSFSSNAEVFHAVLDGNWFESTTWDKQDIPGSTDTVIIDGFKITFNFDDPNYSVNRIEIYNGGWTGNDSKLNITNESILTINNDMILTAKNYNENIELKIQDKGTLNVYGDITFTRTEENLSMGNLSFVMINEGKMNVVGDFIYDYKNADEINEGGSEILLDDNTVLSVAGNTMLKISNGKDFFMELKESSNVILYGDAQMEVQGGKTFLIKTSANSNFTIQGDAYMINASQNSSMVFGSFDNDGKLTVDGNLDISSTVQNAPISIDLSGEKANVEIGGNLTFDAMSDGDVKIEILDYASMELGGNIMRPSAFGAMDMDETGSLTFNGDTPQLIPAINLNGSGLDSLNLSNLVFENTSNEPMGLEGPIVIKNTLVLSDGNIKTSDAGILIIEAGGSIEGGSVNAFIDGPMMKRGSTNGESFLFPVGANGVYAPVTISELTSPNSEYTVQYYSDPPPLGEGLTANVTNVSENGYWEVDKKEESEDVEITLHWTNGEVSDLDNPNALIVVGMNDSTFNFWENYGRSEITGSIDPGASGSITSNLLGDPPPIGTLLFGIGTETVITSSTNNIINDEKIKIFPNPVQDIIQIESEDNKLENVQLEIINQNGQIMFSETINLGSGKFQLTSETANIKTSGIYFLRIISEQGSRITKFNKI